MPFKKKAAHEQAENTAAFASSHTLTTITMIGMAADTRPAPPTALCSPPSFSFMVIFLRVGKDRRINPAAQAQKTFVHRAQSVIPESFLRALGRPLKAYFVDKPSWVETFAGPTRGQGNLIAQRRYFRRRPVLRAFSGQDQSHHFPSWHQPPGHSSQVLRCCRH